MIDSILALLGLKRDVFKSKSIKDYLAVVSSEWALKPLQFIKSFVVAKYLGPEQFGILKTAELVTMLNKFGNLGFNATAQREIGAANGKGDLLRAQIVRNNAYTGEIILTIILFLLGLISSFFVEEGIFVIIIVLASITLLLSKLHGIFTTESIIQRRFKLMAKITFISGVISTIGVISTVPFLGLYSVMIFPIVIETTFIFVYYKNLKFNYEFIINKNEFLDLLKISIPLSAGTLSYGVYRYSERLVILNYLGTKSLGYFGFASTFTDMFITTLFTSLKVRKQRIFELLGKGDYLQVEKIVKTETRILLIISLLAIPVIVLFVYLVIPWLLPKWEDAILVSALYTAIIPLKILGSYESIILTSKQVNKQGFLAVSFLIEAGVLNALAYLIDYFGIFDLNYFILLNIFVILIHIILIKIFYHKYFIKKYVHV